MDYYYCPAGGEGRKLVFENAADGLAWGMKIGANGNLFCSFQETEFRKSIQRMAASFMNMKKEVLQIIWVSLLSI